MKTLPSTPKHYRDITDRSGVIQKQVMLTLEDRLMDVCAVIDNGADLTARFNKLTDALEPVRRERLETSLDTAKAALRDAGTSLHLLTLGQLHGSMAMLRESAESLCLAYLVKHEPTLILLGRKIQAGAASRALHRRHDLGHDQVMADRLVALIERLNASMAADRRIFLGSHFDRNRIPDYYLQLENIKRVAEQAVDLMKELLLVETAK